MQSLWFLEGKRNKLSFVDLRGAAKETVCNTRLWQGDFKASYDVEALQLSSTVSSNMDSPPMDSPFTRPHESMTQSFFETAALQLPQMLCYFRKRKRDLNVGLCCDAETNVSMNSIRVSNELLTMKRLLACR